MAQGPHRYAPFSSLDDPSLTATLADIGTVTVLWSQPVSALQIRCPDGKWRWIKHIDNALVGVVLLIRS